MATAPVRNARFDQFVSLVSDGQHSCSKAAHIVGISTSTGLAWAAQAGIAVPRRAKTLKSEVRKRLEEALHGGLNKAIAAMQFGISPITVTTVLRTTPGLHEAWALARFEHTRLDRRRQWQALQDTHAGAGAKVLRELAPACYAWLYRNDREWLTGQIQCLVSPPRGNNAQTDWDARDRALAAQVERTAALLSVQFPHRPIPLWALFQALPELKAKIGHLDKLPLTQRALTIARRPRRSAPPSLV